MQLHALQQPLLQQQHHHHPMQQHLRQPARLLHIIQVPILPRAIIARAQKPQAQAVPLARPPPRADPWAAVKKAQKEAATVEVEVKSLNKGGLVVALGEISAFIPYREMAAHRTPKDDLQDLTYLVGKKIEAKVVLVDSEAGKVLLSEKRVAQSQAISRLKVGETKRALVSKVEDFGAFVTLLDTPNVSGLVHKSELSWDTFMTVDDVIREGDKVTVKILDVDPAACRVNLSIKQLQQDPLTQTLETVSWGPTNTIPEDIQQVIDKLKVQQAISEVIIMQQAVEYHLFAQELQLFLTKTEVPGGFLIVARSGSTLQQLQVNSSISRDDMKELLASVAKI